LKVLVTTSGFGDIHTLKSVWVEQKIDGFEVDFKRFDDTNYPSRINSMHPRLKGKIFKMLAWEEFPGYDYYIWMDSTFHMIKSKAVEYAIKSIGNADICLFRHPERTNLKDEVDYVTARLQWNDPYISARYGGERIIEQYDSYTNDPDFIGDELFAAGCFIYHKRLVENKDYNLLKEWFYHNCIWSVQDQISLPYLISKFDVKHNLFDTGVYNNPYFQFDMKLYSAQQQ
jgi:hypothetical protein